MKKIVQRHPEFPLIFLDRDGTLIVERDYPGDPRHVKFLPGVLTGLRRLRRAGFPLVVVSNQSGVGRGILTLRQVQRVQSRFLSLIKKASIPLQGYYWCPHAPLQGCSCRKPNLGMVKRAARDLRRSWKNAISVGDRFSDVLLGQRTGGQGILVLTGYGRPALARHTGKKADFVAKNFRSAVEWILRSQKERKRT